MENLLPYFTPQKDQQLFLEKVTELGEARAIQILTPVFKENFHSQAWELSQSLEPYTFAYRIKEVVGDKKLVHQSDWQLFPEKDILEATSSAIRNGLEKRQIELAREKMIEAEIGASTVWISPKKGSDEISCPYPDTQINIAQKISEELVDVRQFQSENLDLKGSARFLISLFEISLVNDYPGLEELMTTVISFPGQISTEEVQWLIRDLTNSPINNENIKDLSELSSENSKKYIQLLRSGVRGEELKRKYAQLLGITGSIASSCGFIGSVHGLSIPTWCEITFSGEIKCKLCEKKLSYFETKSHRCIC